MTHEEQISYIRIAIIFDNFTLNKIFEFEKIISFYRTFYKFQFIICARASRTFVDRISCRKFSNAFSYEKNAIRLVRKMGQCFVH